MFAKEIKMKVFLGGTCAGWKWRDELKRRRQVAKYLNTVEG